MNMPLRETKAEQRLAIVDCDIHPAQRSAHDLYPYLSAHWREHMETFGSHVRQAIVGQHIHPRMMANGIRMDAIPKNGDTPGSDLEMLKSQHLDPNGIETGMLIALSRSGMEERNQDYAAALASAVNDWQLHDWIEKEPRLRAGIVLSSDDAHQAAREIEKRADNKAFAQVLMTPKPGEPYGRRRYWPIYAAAEAANRPIALHPASATSGAPSTGAGWPTYYLGEHFSNATQAQEIITSLIMEGVFERFPKLRFVLVELGFAWAPALGWRLDKHWEKMRKEVPHVKRPPSEYLREHFWFTTQPIDEPTAPRHTADIIDLMGWDHVMFSSDYPHWDFDDPRFALKFRMTDDQRRMVFRDNARALYGLD